MNLRRKRPPEPADREVLAGLVEHVGYHDPDNGFCVLRVKTRGHRDLVTVVGRAAAVAAGEWLTASGQWVNHRTHGHQFKAHFLRSSAPSSTEGIEKYLRSGLIRGIGRVYARKLVQAFGDKVLDVIETEPERLREVAGIGPVRAGRITGAWAEQKAVREIMVFLHSHGVGTARAVRIFKTYGSDAVEVITNNPYRLTRDIRGIGFRIADAIAMKLGITRTAMTRVRAGIGYALTEAMDDGHCGLPADELGPLAARLLDVPDDAVRTALELELAEGAVVADTVADTPCVFLGGLYRAERAIAERLVDLVAGKLPWPDIDVERALPWVEKQSGLSLAPGQAEAVRLALRSKATVITGGPGVGKTTLVDAILRILAAKRVELVLCAPTGRAARRMSEATGQQARTIHRLLEVDPATGGFRRDARQSARLRSAGRRRSLHGRRLADAGAACRSPRQGRPADRGRHRSTPLGGAGAGAGRHHRLGHRPGRALDRGLPPGGAQPHRDQRARDQSRGDPRPVPAGRRQRLLLRAGRRPRDGRRPDRRPGEDADTEDASASTPSATSRSCAR